MSRFYHREFSYFLILLSILLTTISTSFCIASCYDCHSSEDFCYSSQTSFKINSIFQNQHRHLISRNAMTNKDSYVLVTGGTGFIGSFTALELIKTGHKIVIIDNLSNSSTEPLNRIKKLANITEDIPFHKVDLMNYDDLVSVFEKYNFSSVIHFAALKAVGESSKIPLIYYENNLSGTINLLSVMSKFNVKNIVFSSSATVYKFIPGGPPMKEGDETGSTNPYGRTKLFMESIITDVVNSEPGWNAVLLRYFNPTGAHPSGMMGEDPLQIPNNLMPYVSQVAIGKLKEVHVFGNDYNTLDGTGVRDYIHVVDLAEAHVLSMKKFEPSTNSTSTQKSNLYIYNLGSGTGYSVLQMIEAMAKACGHQIPYVVDPRRPGDVDVVVCNPKLAEKELGFKIKLNLDDMCKDLWKWQSLNPKGYTSE
ncbi:UDP-glucose 4-epimerase [Smittium culicis]|uniref:UDP-glucose 4-epimerase n=1 Tax=Smittium culicis TaxID=133412 RepID=A0A1R1Y5I8_9FUNG|nr:UDP-glucose 4-epimerase [Smittium culicis]OMJ15748.1 UDP-glucose 4-epimerase [Smittium culicis]OMJ22100.1 UDP-glucose 4-epimerase [Smittium culicis]